jgi:hypothetical protein
MVSDTVVRQAIYTRLNVAGITTLLGSGSAGIRHGVAPSDVAYPLLIFNKQAGTTTNRMGGEAFKAHVWLVKGVSQVSAGAAEAIDKAANDLLHFGDLTITGADDMYLSRESDVNYAEFQGDTTFWHVGGLYRLIVQNS